MRNRRGRAGSSGSGAGAAPDPRLRALYAVEPGAFVAARDRLARALAAERDPSAERVRRLRRPTVPVWLLNAIARERPDVLEALLGAADGLRRAQVRALAGHGAELRLATAAMHDAVVEVLAAARAVSAGLGRGPTAATLGDVERGARALAIDPGARQALREGILDRVPEAGGAELLSGLAVVPVDRDHEGQMPMDRDHEGQGSAAPGARPHRRDRSDGGGSVSERAEAARRGEERRRAAADARRHARAVAVAEGRVRTAEARARTAEERVRDVTRLLEEARRRVAAARKDAEAARAAARRAPRG